MHTFHTHAPTYHIMDHLQTHANVRISASIKTHKQRAIPFFFLPHLLISSCSCSFRMSASLTLPPNFHTRPSPKRSPPLLRATEKQLSADAPTPSSLGSYLASSTSHLTAEDLRSSAGCEPRAHMQMLHPSGSRLQDAPCGEMSVRQTCCMMPIFTQNHSE